MAAAPSRAAARSGTIEKAKTPSEANFSNRNGLYLVRPATTSCPFLPNPNIELVLAALSLLTLFSLDGFGHVTEAWIHSVPMKLVGGLPYIRPFTPQFIMPLFLLCGTADPSRPRKQPASVGSDGD